MINARRRTNAHFLRDGGPFRNRRSMLQLESEEEEKRNDHKESS